MLNKPCVINISAGTYYGSHDGKDLQALGLSRISSHSGMVVHLFVQPEMPEICQFMFSICILLPMIHRLHGLIITLLMVTLFI